MIFFRKCQFLDDKLRTSSFLQVLLFSSFNSFFSKNTLRKNICLGDLSRVAALGFPLLGNFLLHKGLGEKSKFLKHRVMKIKSNQTNSRLIESR